ncbi:MAG: hypothetical protein KKH77_05710 [Candidatus Omnitrophica bacterium]|nr:hypothetical protein [Candidatus Omnitrophota bacterium]MBU1808962.1 hypothetical protein [Candidatus Omnitrophota bacterium]
MMKRSGYLLFFLLIVYLLTNTGIVSDDFGNILSLRNSPIMSALIPDDARLVAPLTCYTHLVWYHFSDLDNLAIINILKIFYLLLSFYMVSKFFSLYTNKINAALISFFFIFFPSHDSTVYWFLGQYLTITISCYLYAYYLAYKDRLFTAAAMSIVASFISYGSPPVALALFVIFALDRKFKKGLIILLPNIVYSAYYLFIAKVLSSGTDHVPANLTLFSLGKRFLLQLAAFFDATLGPSIWLKIYYSFSQLSFVSIAIGIAVAVFLYFICVKGSRKYDMKLIVGLIVLTLSSIFIFSVTGKYPGIAFNLGNRTTIFGSLLIVYLLVLLPGPKMLRYAILTVLFLSILGISDHWKAWNSHVGEVTAKISHNEKLKNHGGELVFVSGNQYSKFGRLSHIEFFSEAAAVSSYFDLIPGSRVVARPLNRRHKYEDGQIIDTKYGVSEEARGHITVYDSEKDEVLDVRSENINKYIASLPPDNRHWIQLINSKRIKDIILKIMPRLKYAL